MSDLRELLERCMGRGGNQPTNEEIARAALLAELRITELENALLEAADILEGCAEFELNYIGENCRKIAKGEK